MCQQLYVATYLFYSGYLIVSCRDEPALTGIVETRNFSFPGATETSKTEEGDQLLKIPDPQSQEKGLAGKCPMKKSTVSKGCKAAEPQLKRDIKFHG